MKKILIALSLIVALISLTGCDLRISDPNITIDQIENENVDIIQIQNSLSNAINKVNKRCIGVVNMSPNKEKIYGSGIIYKILDRKSKEPATEKTVEAECYAITNEHVIKPRDKNTSYRIYIAENKYFMADVLGADAKNDLAVLKFILPLGKSTIEYNDYEDLSKESLDFPARGSYAIAIGCPYGPENFNYPTIGLVGSVSLDLINHSANIYPGSSGGGLFNSSGRLIGINVYKKVVVENPDTKNPQVLQPVGLAIPIWTVQRVVKQIESVNMDIVRPDLDITLKEINSGLYPEQSSLLPTGFNEGIMIEAIAEDGIAKGLEGEDNDNNTYLGLSSNDIITEINENKVVRIQEFNYYLNSLSLGDTITLVVYRKLDSGWTKIEFQGKLKG